MRLPTLVPTALVLLASTAQATFEDEAYNVDYAYTLLGLPRESTTFFHKPRKDEKASLLYTLSDQGVLGAVNPGTGDVVWRQFLRDQFEGWSGIGERDPVDARLNGSVRASGEVVVSVVGGNVVAWDAMTGRSRWGNEFLGVGRDVEVLEGVGSVADGDVLVLYEGEKAAVTRRLDGKTGDVVWEHTSDSGDVAVQVSTDVKSVFVITLHGKWGGYNVKVETLDPITGKKTGEHELAAKSDVQSVEDIIFVGANSAAPIVAWVENGHKTVKVNVLGSKTIHSLPLASGGEEIERVSIHAPRAIQSLPHFLVQSQSKTSHWAEVYHIDLKNDKITEAYHLPRLSGRGSFSTSEIDANVFFTRNTEDEVVVVGSSSHAILARWTLDAATKKAGLLHSVSEVVKTKGDTYSVRSAAVNANDEWVVIRNGAPSWTRPEGLSGIVAAAWAEIPVGEDLAETLEAEAHSNPVAAYIHRVNRHIADLQHLPAYLAGIPQAILSSILPGDTVLDSSETLARDTFGFHKLVIAATERGRIYALDSGNKGRVVWSLKAFDLPVGEKWNVKAISVDNKKATVTVRGSGGEVIVLSSETGAIVETKWRGADSVAVQTTALVDSPSGPWLLNVGPGGVIAPVPAASAPAETVVVRGKNGEVKGVSFVTKGDKAHPIDVWTFKPAKGEKIYSIAARPALDPVASIGRVLADRTVLYKYINPNTILITATSASTSSASFYLLDTSSGALLYSTTHAAVDITMPIASIMSENWFAYSLFSDLAPDASGGSPKGNQLIVSELYESALSNDRGPLGMEGNYSALLPSETPSDEAHLPHVKTASFIIPEPVSAMTTTSTLQGITSKSLLLTLPISNSIVALPRQLLDPRRPAGRPPTKGEQEEGLIPYAPYLEFDPKLVITHKREVLGVRAVLAEPALIESTSLVFAYGVDVFGTRVSPSGAFDVLGKGFNKLSLVITVVGLLAGTLVLKPLVSRKQINGRWKTA